MAPLQEYSGHRTRLIPIAFHHAMLAPSKVVVRSALRLGEIHYVPLSNLEVRVYVGPQSLLG